MDTTTPHGELLFSIFGALAQYERALTRERVSAGLAAAKRRGRRAGESWSRARGRCAIPTSYAPARPQVRANRVSFQLCARSDISGLH